MCKPNFVLGKPKSALKKVYIAICKPQNLGDLEIFCKPLLSRCTLVCDVYVPHITGLICEVPFLGVQYGLHGLHRFTLLYMGLPPDESGRCKPLLGGLTVEETAIKKSTKREEQGKRSAVTLRRQKAEKA